MPPSKSAETADIPVIFVTAKDRYEDLSKGFEVGGIDYLTKPFEPIELAARVRSAIFTKRLQDELRKTAGDLKRMEQSRKELIGMLGHDIRNLANSVVAFMQLVRMGQLKPPARVRQYCVSRSRTSASCFEFHALLDVSKRGKIEAMPVGRPRQPRRARMAQVPSKRREGDQGGGTLRGRQCLRRRRSSFASSRTAAKPSTDARRDGERSVRATAP